MRIIRCIACIFVGKQCPRQEEEDDDDETDDDVDAP